MKKALNTLVLFVCLSACEEFTLESEADTFFHVRIQGTELPVWVKGNTASKKFIVYINGGPGLTSIDVARADMFNWSEGLEDSFAMVYYDQRGTGNAQGNINENTITVAQYVEDLDDIITVLNTKYANPDIYLMGHSFGGFIGANYLLRDELAPKISAWISVNGAYNFDFDLSWEYRRAFLINIANEEIANDQNVEHWTDALAWANDNQVILSRDQKNEWRSFIGWPGGIIIPEELAELSVRDYLGIGFASSYNPFPSYLSQNLEIVNDLLNEDAEGSNLIEAVETIELPVLMITGRYDDLIVPEESREVFNHFGSIDKSFEILPNSSHEPYISDPSKFKQLISDFVNQH